MKLGLVRGIAILVVLDSAGVPFEVLSYPFRLAGFPNFGRVGVHIFFVPSGFLLGGFLAGSLIIEFDNPAPKDNSIISQQRVVNSFSPPIPRESLGESFRSIGRLS